MTCLDDETVLGLVEGRLEQGALAVIDHHLDTCASCRDVVTHVARSRTQVLERGTTLGRYVVGDLLGAGAMGRVYSAWEPELDRRVAIKVLQDDVAGARERLVREAQAMARLDQAMLESRLNSAVATSVVGEALAAVALQAAQLARRSR